MADYGAGPAFDSNFDFIIDRSGDIDAVDGPNELRKDLVILISGALEDGDGIDQPPTVVDGLRGKVVTDGDGTLVDAEQALQRLISTEPRIDSVVDIDITIPTDGRVDTVDVSIQLLVDDDIVEFDRVFPITD